MKSEPNSHRTLRKCCYRAWFFLETYFVDLIIDGVISH